MCSISVQWSAWLYMARRKPDQPCTIWDLAIQQDVDLEL